MKKVLFGLGVVAALSFPIVGMAYGEYYKLDEDPTLKYIYPTINNSELQGIIYHAGYPKGKIETLQTNNLTDIPFNKVGEPDFKELYFPISVESMNNIQGTYETEGGILSADFLQYFHNLDVITVGGHAMDFRPVENSKKLKNLEISNSPIASFDFIKQLKTLEDVYIIANKELETHDDNTLVAITDISFFNELDKLESIDFKSIDRAFPTISLKKLMDKYVLVNPFILSKQFKNPEVEITSKTPGFTFEDDILTWDGITPETKELQISWEFNSDEGGNFTFSGDSVIPINWID